MLVIQKLLTSKLHVQSFRVGRNKYRSRLLLEDSVPSETDIFRNEEKSNGRRYTPNLNVYVNDSKISMLFFRRILMWIILHSSSERKFY